jgi:hypothetical protein
MILSHQRICQLGGVLLSLAALCLPAKAETPALAQVTNPISRIARLFNPQLVKVEDRMDWLGNQISSYAKRCEYPLKTDLGYRGGRIGSGDADPSITLDLGDALTPGGVGHVQGVAQAFLFNVRRDLKLCRGLKRGFSKLCDFFGHRDCCRAQAVSEVERLLCRGEIPMVRT